MTCYCSGISNNTVTGFFLEWVQGQIQDLVTSNNNNNDNNDNIKVKSETLGHAYR